MNTNNTMTIKATFTKTPAFLSVEIVMGLSSLSDFDEAIEELKANREAFALFQRTPASIDNTGEQVDITTSNARAKRVEALNYAIKAGNSTPVRAAEMIELYLNGKSQPQQ